MIGENGKALTLFRSGLDTIEIVRRLNVPQVTEPVVLKMISEQRSAELQLPSPYQTLALVRSA